MEKRIKITQEENERVQRIYIEFCGYCNILGYLAKSGSIDTNIFDKKWEEAVWLNHLLEEAQQEIEAEYHPDDNEKYSNYEFDFFNQEIVYKT